jgi:NAD(P)-dependent dehydrogenase (short-subunit alcohol dehydrogenase family)
VSNKIIVNTGARNGIGEATAIRLAGDGHHVVVTARRTDRLAQIADRIAASGAGQQHCPTPSPLRSPTRSANHQTWTSTRSFYGPQVSATDGWRCRLRPLSTLKCY